MAKKQVITSAEAAEIIGVSQRMVLNLIKDGKMESEKVGNHHVIAKSEAVRVQRERAKALKEAEKAKKAKEKALAKKNVSTKKKPAVKAAKQAKKGGRK